MNRRAPALPHSAVLEAIGVPVMATDSTGAIICWNRSAQDQLGWPASEVLGGHYSRFAQIDGTDQLDLLRTRLARGEGFSGGLKIRHRDGRMLNLYAAVSPWSGGDAEESPAAGRLTPAVCVLADRNGAWRDADELRRVAALVESSGDAINGATPDGIITSWNAGAERMYGYTAQEAIGASVAMLTPEGLEGADEALRNLLAAGVPIIGHELQGRRKDGSTLDVSLTFSPVYDAQGNLAGTSAIARDITELARLRVAAEQERDRLCAAQEMAHVGSVEADLASGRIWCSDEFCRIHGLPVRPGQDREACLETVHPGDRDRIVRLWQQLEQGGPPQDFTYRVLRRDGVAGWVHARASAVPGAGGPPAKLVMTAMDITERKQSEEALERLAFQDPLTGLANRALLTERIQQAVGDAAGGRRGLHVFFLDVDRLKVVNDGMGHAAGDSLLVQLADRLHRQVRREDTLARFAGDEFVIVCQDLLPGAAGRLAERIRAAMQAPFELLQREVFASVSVGIARYEDGATAESLLHDADAAMYRAKESGRRAAVLFDGQMHRAAESRLDIESELNRAVERGELRIHYQPILDLHSRAPIGFEALLRWQHPRHGLLGPDRFIPIAEETGLIVPIGSWVLHEALRQTRHWQDTMPGAAGWRIAVNLSARQLQDPGLYDTVAGAIDAAGIDPGSVELEITESVLMQDVDKSLDTLTRLRSLGVGLSVDDFGTGYSSLGYLRRFPVTTLKIDRSFVDGLGGTDADAGNIVEWITGLADALRLEVVAEGVETADQLRELDRLNAHLAQGFLWARPLPADDVAGWCAGLPPAGAVHEPRLF